MRRETLTAADWWILTPAFLALYMFTYWTSDVFRLAETGSTPWNPEAGLALAAIYFTGWRSVPLLGAIHFLCLAIWAPFSTPVWTLMIATGHTTAMAGVILMAREHFGGLARPGSTAAARFVLAALAATAASAVLQMAIAVFATDWSLYKILRFGMTVSVGNMVGIVTVFPLLLHFPAFRNVTGFLRNAWWGGTLLMTLLIVTCVAVFGFPGLDQFKFFYLVFVPVIAMALRDGTTGAVLAALIASGSMILVLSIRDYNAGTVAELQFLMIVLSVTGLVLGAVIDERQRLHLESVEYLTRLRDSEDALMRASRISLASEMVAAVSHELAQPLSAARSHVRALKRRLEQPRRDRAKDVADIDAAVVQIDSAASTIRDMREFLRRGEAERTPLQLEQLVRTAIDLMGPELRRGNILIHINGFDGLPPVLANRTQIAQVLLNLVRNARDAIAEAGRPNGEISIAAERDRPGFAEICVTDNGPGVSPHIGQNLFAPLKSTKPEGLGLGLSLCKSIITNHGGELWHDSASRAGTRFCFTLPYAHSVTKGAGPA